MTTQALKNAKATDQVFTQYDRTWEQFKHIQKGLEGSPGVRLAFYDGVVEVLMPRQAHEIFRKIVGFLLEMFLFEKGINVVPTGSVTQEQEGEASAQADESYCFGAAKPIPDLSIEVIFTSGSVAKLKRYQALGVPEVWFWQDGLFTLYRLGDSGYVQIERSQFLELSELDLALFTRCILMGETNWLGAATEFRKGLGVV
ncbi:MAG: Uma2 family endonuclease [Phormidesmis sp. CAN_BIN36]|nr:Uma2 family endonuclease [Phormidesmis sp. CAN_BIN36]